MESQCCVLGCTHSQDEEIKLHRFPFDDHLLLPIWIMATNRLNWVPNDSSRMCDKHFNIDDYESGNRNNGLKPNACPIIAPSISTSDVIKTQVYSNTLRGDDSASENNFSDVNSDDLSDCDTPNTSDLIISDDSSLFSDSSMEVCSILGDSNDVEHSDVENKNNKKKSEQEEDSISISSYTTNYDETERIPVQKCAVTLCNQNARNQFDKLFYINFPVEKKTLSDCWWTLCGQQTDFDRTAKICSIHFDAADFINKTIQKDGQIYRQTSLKNDSVVPSLYLSPEEYVRFSKKRRKKVDKIDEPNVKKMSIENYKCSIQSCTKTSLNGENTIFFAFPSNDQLKLEAWVNNLKMPGWKPHNTDRICSDHFESDQIIKTHNGYEPTLNAKPVFKPKKPFLMPTNTTNKKNLNIDKKVIKQPSIKVTYKRISSDCIMVNEVTFKPDKCNKNSNQCTTSERTDILKENKILNVQKSSLKCKEKTLEYDVIDLFEKLEDNLVVNVESIIRADIETESNITQEVSEKEDLPPNNVIGLDHVFLNLSTDKNIELLNNLSMTSLENQLLQTNYLQETTENYEKQKLVPEKCIEDTSVNDETQELVPEICITEVDTEEFSSSTKNYLEYIYTDTHLEFIQECVVDNNVNNETQELVSEKCTEEITVNNKIQEQVTEKYIEDVTANNETQVLMLEKCALEDTEKTESSKSNNQFEYIHTDTPLEFIQECVIETTINDEADILVPEKCIIQDKEENELVNNKNHIKNIHANTPLKFIQKCEVETTVNNENQVIVTEKCIRDTSVNKEPQNIVLESSIIQENKYTVGVDENNQNNFYLCASKDKNNEQLPNTHSKKRLRSTKSKLQGKKVKNDKEENELVNNKNHLEYIHADTPLKFIQECEVETTVNNKTQLLLTEEHLDETTLNNENQVIVSEKCTTEPSVNTETPEIVLESSIIQENKYTVGVDENNQNNVFLCVSNDKNNEQFPITDIKKRLRHTKSKIQEKKVKNGIPASIIYDQELTECYGEMLPPFCEPNCQILCYNAIPGPQRLKIFKAFQLLLSVTEQNCTIAKLVQVRKIKNHEYYPTFCLLMGEKLVVVCRSFFINTLGITERRLNSILKPVNYDWYCDKENALRANLPKQVNHVDEPIVVTDFMKESLLLDKDYDLYISDNNPCASIDEVPEDEYENVVVYLKTVPRVLSSYDVPGECQKQFFETTINLDFMYKGYSEKYSKNGKLPPYTKQQFVQIYNRYMKSFFHKL